MRSLAGKRVDNKGNRHKSPTKAKQDEAIFEKFTKKGPEKRKTSKKNPEKPLKEKAKRK